MAEEAKLEVVPTIHGRGAARLDAVVELVRALARHSPLTELLDEVPRRVAAVLGSEVCSMYLREGDDLVMRGNVGFTTSALGEVRLHAGEGLVGTAVECMRPVSADMAPHDARFRAFSMLGEERFPAFLAVPVPGASGASGALVVQRSSGAYAPHDVELLMALAGAVAPLLERARIVDAGGPRTPSPTAGTRRVTVPARPVVGGRALGVLGAVQRPSTRAGTDAKATPKELAKALERVIAGCVATLDAQARSAAERGLDAGFLALARSILDDGRLRERTLELAKGRGLLPALAQVAREATRAARITHDATVTERAMEMSEICDALRAMLVPEAAGALRKGTLWVGETVTVFELLLAPQVQPAGLVLTAPLPAGRARTLVEMLGVPTVCEAAGILQWASDGDVALVDGDHGLVRVNPSRRERDEARLERGEGHD